VIMDWQKAHEALTELARRRAGLEFEEGCWLRVALAAGAHRQLGYGSFTEYIERLFGYAARLTHDKLRVAEALECLPELTRSLRAGSVSWSAVRELTRVATPQTEQVWLEAARGRSMREVEKLVSGHRFGDLPTDARDEQAIRHVLRFEVSGEVLATFREAVAQLRRETGGSLDDDAALLLMARRVLASVSGANDANSSGDADGSSKAVDVASGRASYQLSVTVCEECQRATQTGGGESISVSPAMVEMARCDALVLPSAHVGAGSTRATQTIPPAVRRDVLCRDQHRCQVPGCRHSAFVDVHHIQTRASRGKHEPENLLTLCGAHHRAVHRGTLLIEGRVSSGEGRVSSGAASVTSTGLRFLHADGTPYGGPVLAVAADIRAKAFRALRALGFSERNVHRALLAARRDDTDADRPLTHVGTGSPPPGSTPSVESIVRSALRHLTEQALAKAS
jgi:hypothetical protein